jgi:hypothetical protein
MKGTKQRKSKDRLTLMIATAANGDKLPLAIISQAAKPACFKFCGGIPPMFYKNKKNGWFDRSIPVWWLNTVFWPYHIKNTEMSRWYCCLITVLLTLLIESL